MITELKIDYLKQRKPKLASNTSSLKDLIFGTYLYF
jgi:hypothetical protein